MIDKMAIPCFDLANEKAEEFVKSGAYQKMYTERQLSNVKALDVELSTHVDAKAERRDERRRKATGGKIGGGTQGRETKTKSVKKHSRTKATQDSDSDDGSYVQQKKTYLSTAELVSVKELKKVLNPLLEAESIEYLCTDIAAHIHP